MKIFVIPLVLLLAGCSLSPKLIVPENKVVLPPDNLYNCPIVKTFPKAATLTNEELGTLIIKLQKNNLTCKQSLDAVKQFLDEADKKITVTTK